MPSPMQLLRVASLLLIVAFHQLVQRLRHLALHHSLDRALVLRRHQVHTLVQLPMTEQQRRNRSGMVPPGLAPTRARIGRSIRASTPTRESMDPSIEPGGDAPFGDRRASVLLRRLLPKRRRQGQRAWGDQPTSPLEPWSLSPSPCWRVVRSASLPLRRSVHFSRL